MSRISITALKKRIQETTVLDSRALTSLGEEFGIHPLALEYYIKYHMGVEMKPKNKGCLPPEMLIKELSLIYEQIGRMTESESQETKAIISGIFRALGMKGIE